MIEGSQIELLDAGFAAHVARYHLSQRDLAAADAALAPCANVAVDAPRDRRALAEAFADLANAYLARKDIAHAEAALSNAERFGETATLLRVTAALAQLRGDKSVARESWRKVVQVEPDNGAAWLGLARVSEQTGDRTDAVTAYLKAVERDPSHANTLSIAARLAAIDPVDNDTPSTQQVRIALIGSSTLDHIRDYLQITCRQANLTPAFYVGPFGQYAQDILDPASALHRFAPDVIIVAIHGRSLFADLYDYPFDLPAEERQREIDRVVGEMTRVLGQLAARSTALVLAHTFATPQYSPLGALDLRDPLGQTAIFAEINRRVAEHARAHLPSVHLVDEDRIYGRIGKRHVTDPRMWSLARIGIGEGVLGALTREYMRYIKALKGRNRKCLVLDLDNTLWGGVVGEDGPSGIKLGQEAPGNAYLAFQQAILGLYKRGIILAINSKNNESDALEVIERHPDMLLRPSHFAALRINWQDKASNLESIAEELNIGLDSLVFMDDNPAECAMVRGRLPQVLTVQLPRDPALYRRTLLEMTDFDTLTLTDEDRTRGQLYVQRRQRQEWETKQGDNLEDYLADLGLEVEVAIADEYDLPRVAQLIGKTNQFNLTTRRHTEAQVRSFAASKDHLVLTARVRDRFGDHGLVGVAIAARDDANAWAIDTFLLSCRVLGRGVETAVLSALASLVREQGAMVLRGLFAPTPKNEPARDFYRRHALTLEAEEQGRETWIMELLAHTPSVPTWISLQLRTDQAATVTA